MAEKSTNKDCFIIMPIADTDGYPAGHFKHVYNNIIAPSCEMAGYKAVRADDVKATNLIHLDILKKLIEAPIAVCDLSSRNPNVLFELGLRQAFDRPVVLVQEIGTPRIFDIAPLRYLEYSKEMKYHEVLKSQGELKVAIEETIAAVEDAGNVNSIVKLLALNQSARIPDLKDDKEILNLELLKAEVREMKQLLEFSIQEKIRPSPSLNVFPTEFERVLSVIRKIRSPKKFSSAEKASLLQMAMLDIDELSKRCKTISERAAVDSLLEELNAASNGTE